MLVAKKPLYQPAVPEWQGRPRVEKRPRSLPIARADKVMVVAAVLLMGALTLGLVWRFTQINDLGYRITRLEQQIGTLQQANAGLIVDLKKLSSPSQIEKRAEQELGMQWPTEKQIVNVASGLVPVEH